MKMRRKTALIILLLWTFAIASAIAETTIIGIQPRRYVACTYVKKHMR